MNLPDFIDWNYDENIATRWERLGKCNQCGTCCRVTIHIITCGGLTTEGRDGGYGTDQEGLWHEYGEGEIRRYFKLRPIRLDEISPSIDKCLGKDGKTCTVHKSEDRGLICTGFPFSPRNIELFPECSFWFRPLDQWEIEPIEYAIMEDAEMIKEQS